MIKVNSNNNLMSLEYSIQPPIARNKTKKLLVELFDGLFCCEKHQVMIVNIWRIYEATLFYCIY